MEGQAIQITDQTLDDMRQVCELFSQRIWELENEDRLEAECEQLKALRRPIKQFLRESSKELTAV